MHVSKLSVEVKDLGLVAYLVEASHLAILHNGKENSAGLIEWNDEVCPWK